MAGSSNKSGTKKAQKREKTNGNAIETYISICYNRYAETNIEKEEDARNRCLPFCFGKIKKEEHTTMKDKLIPLFC